MRRRALGTDLTAYRLCNPGALKPDDVSLEPAAAQPLQPIKSGTAEGRSGFRRSAREARGCLDSTAEEVSSQRCGSDTRVGSSQEALSSNSRAARLFRFLRNAESRLIRHLTKWFCNDLRPL